VPDGASVTSEPELPDTDVDGEFAAADSDPIPPNGITVGRRVILSGLAEPRLSTSGH